MILIFVSNFKLRKDARSIKKNGYTFYFFSNEHLPVHIHVRKGDGEAKFEFKDNGKVELKKSINMKVAELKLAQALAVAYQDEIMDEWLRYFNE